MIPFYKKYISALVHNPNVIQNHNIVKTGSNKLARKAITLLQRSKYSSKGSRISSAWFQLFDGRIYPPFHNLYALITNREIDEFDKEEILEHFSKEVIFLQHVYLNVEPDKETLKQRPMNLNLFGVVLFD